jgi:hypothetical protein
MSMNEASNVYRALARHQTTEDWEFRELLNALHRWTGVLDFEFKLQIPHVALSVDWLSSRRLGHFREGCNGFGLRGEIALNRKHLADRPFWNTLGTVLHELLHAWQSTHRKPGKNNYHNVAYRRRAAELGLIVDSYGHTQYASDSPFLEVLQKYGVEIPALPEPKMYVRGASKLKLWMCPCNVRVRVAVSRFRAKCLLCGGEFTLVD